MIVKLVGCDNPFCDETGTPEHQTPRSHRPPYGWLTTKAVSQGTGINLVVETCSIECISPAVMAVYKHDQDEP